MTLVVNTLWDKFFKDLVCQCPYYEVFQGNQRLHTYGMNMDVLIRDSVPLHSDIVGYHRKRI